MKWINSRQFHPKLINHISWYTNGDPNLHVNGLTLIQRKNESKWQEHVGETIVLVLMSSCYFQSLWCAQWLLSQSKWLCVQPMSSEHLAKLPLLQRVKCRSSLSSTENLKMITLNASLSRWKREATWRFWRNLIFRIGVQLPALMARIFSSNGINFSFATKVHFTKYEQEWSKGKRVKDFFYIWYDLIRMGRVIPLKFP